MIRSNGFPPREGKVIISSVLETAATLVLAPKWSKSKKAVDLQYSRILVQNLLQNALVPHVLKSPKWQMLVDRLKPKTASDDLQRVAPPVYHGDLSAN